MLRWWIRRTSDNAHVSVRSEFQSASHYSPRASGARAVQSLWGCVYSPSVPFFLAMALLSVTHVSAEITKHDPVLGGDSNLVEH